VVREERTDQRGSGWRRGRGRDRDREEEGEKEKERELEGCIACVSNVKTRERLVEEEEAEEEEAEEEEEDKAGAGLKWRQKPHISINLSANTD